MKIEISRPRVIKILGLDSRGKDDLVWCSLSMEVSKLFWIDGLLICMEVPEKSFDYEYEDGIYVVSQLCYAEYPKYNRFEDVGRGIQIPIVNVKGMRVFESIAKTIRENEKRLKAEGE